MQLQCLHPRRSSACLIRRLSEKVISGIFQAAGLGRLTVHQAVEDCPNVIFQLALRLCRIGSLRVHPVHEGERTPNRESAWKASATSPADYLHNI